MAPRSKSTEIRQFIIDNVDQHPAEIAKLTAEQFQITRQAVRRHLTTLIEDGILKAEGETRKRRYSLVVTEKGWGLSLAENREEDRVWRELIEPRLAGIPKNITKICNYGFTEIYNNAVDHSSSIRVKVVLETSARSIRMSIWDDGVGIFEKIRSAFGLEDHRHAILELSKGKLTTDPTRHTGEGIFFSSRAFDEFSILSGHLAFLHRSRGDYLIEVEPVDKPGTFVSMSISTTSDRELRRVFDSYTNVGGDYLFSKTHVPLSLAKYGDDQLVSRSQARRILARFERFEEVMLDFAGIEEIGQAFADEIFRVFRTANPQITLVHVNANDRVKQMISRAEKASGRLPEAGT
jgi:anti-sigma regulatory factor (Ser/Thr protein kinase)